MISRLVKWLLVCLGTLMCANNALANESVADAKRMLAELPLSAPVQKFADTGRSFGQLVDAVRSGEPSLETISNLRAVAGSLQERARAKLRALEAEAGDNEAALERLYRSRDWDTLSFALAAFPYWQAWLDLTSADLVVSREKKNEHVYNAKRGFRASSVQIVHPGLVYGGWLGLCYVARAEGRDAYARELLERLDQALRNSPNNPLREVVQLELRLAKARSGEVSKGSLSAAEAQALDAAESRLLSLEAFALLDEHRKSEVGARDAAVRLKRILSSKQADDALIARILEYREEIVGHDIGPAGFLVSAEDALINEHFYTADEKYREFFSRLPRHLDIDWNRFRYRHAVAALRGDLVNQAVRLVDNLLARKDLDAEVRKASVKLAYLAWAERYSRTRTDADRRRALKATQRFIDGDPSDPVADDARLFVAQISNSADVANSALSGIRAREDKRGAIADVRFQVVARNFAAALRSGDDAKALVYARDGARLGARLLDDKKAPIESRALVIQMRTMIGDKPDELLNAIGWMSQLEGLRQPVREMLLWSQFKLLSRPGQENNLRGAFAELGTRTLEPWQAEQAYTALQGLSDPALKDELSGLLIPALANSPDIARRLQLQALEQTVISAQDPSAAYEEARTFVEANPRSGDAWRVLALAAEQADELFDAEKAWAVVTGNVRPDKPLWLTGMLRRLEIRANSTRPQSACEIVLALRAFQERLSVEQASALESAAARANCQGET